jgi:hypothetical protein
MTTATLPPRELATHASRSAAQRFSPTERLRQSAEDSFAWRTVCLELIAIVAAGALAMALVVAAISL